MEWNGDSDKERNIEAVRDIFLHGQVRNFEVNHVDSTGHIIPIEINATVVDGGSGPEILAICRDISDRKKAEEAFKLNAGNGRRHYSS